MNEQAAGRATPLMPAPHHRLAEHLDRVWPRNPLLFEAHAGSPHVRAERVEDASLVCLRHPCMTSGADPGYRGPRESGAACPTGVVSSASGNPARRHCRGHVGRAREPNEQVSRGSRMRAERRHPCGRRGAQRARCSESYFGGAGPVI